MCGSPEGSSDPSFCGIFSLTDDANTTAAVGRRVTDITQRSVVVRVHIRIAETAFGIDIDIADIPDHTNHESM